MNSLKYQIPITLKKYQRWMPLLGVAAVALPSTLALLRRRHTSDTQNAITPQNEQVKRISTIPNSAVYSGSPSTNLESRTQNYADYLIIGGGASAASAIKVIKANDPNSKVVMISKDKILPFNKSMLRRDMWTCSDDQLDTMKFKRADDKEVSLYTIDEDCFTSESPSSKAITLFTNRKVTNIDIKQSVATLDDGWKITFDKALLATGSDIVLPQCLRNTIDSDRLFDRVIRLRSTDDLKKARKVIENSGANSITIIGSQMESVELACTLASKYHDKKIKLICCDKKGILGTLLPPWFVKRCKHALELVGVEVIQSPGLINISLSRKNQLLVKFKCDDVFPRQEGADIIFLADRDIAKDSITHDGLIETDDHSAYVTGPELRIFDNIWLDIGEVSIESVGLVHSDLNVDSVIFHFQDSSKFEFNKDERLPENGDQAILFYYVNDKVVGILLWNIVGKIRIARQIISEQRHKSEIRDIAKRIMSFVEDYDETKESEEIDGESSQDMGAIFK